MSTPRLSACLVLVLPFALSGCHDKADTAAATASPTATANRPVDIQRAYRVQPWALPGTAGSAQPDLVATGDGRLLLSWISRVPGRRNALEFSAFGPDRRWRDAPRTVVVGNSLMANWANPPHITATDDGALWVQWVQKSGDGEEAGDVALSRSRDGGANWSPPALVNDDGTATEHGFVALWPASPQTIGVAWLDGRAKAGGDMHAHAQAHAGGHDMHDMHDAGAMSLRAALFDGAMRRSAETQVDGMTCDCCQTAVAVAAQGAVLAYRDRTPQEIRDIAVVRFDGSRWSAPTLVHDDHWKMPGCPVNGPAIAAAGDNVVVAWYTAPDDKPAVQIARSADGGAHFAAAVSLDRGDAVLGRVAVAVDADQAWVAWLREDAGKQSLWLARYTHDLSRQLQRVRVATLHARGAASGYPRMALRDGAAWLVWSDTVDGAPQVQGARVGPG